MNHRHHVRANFVDFAVNESLRVAVCGGTAACGVWYCFAVQVVLDDIGGRNESGRSRTREEIPVWIARIADAHMSIAVHYTLVCKDVIRHDQLLDNRSMGRRLIRPLCENRNGYRGDQQSRHLLR